MIADILPFKGDNVADSNASAVPSTDTTNQIDAFNDRDVYQFQAEEGDRIKVRVMALGDYPTLNTQSLLYDGAGTQVAENDLVPASPPPDHAGPSLHSKINHTADGTGTYFLHVKGNGYAGGVDYNHSAYGVVGRYSVKISINDVVITPIITLLLDDD